MPQAERPSFIFAGALLALFAALLPPALGWCADTSLKGEDFFGGSLDSTIKESTHSSRSSHSTHASHTSHASHSPHSVHPRPRAVARKKSRERKESVSASTGRRGHAAAVASRISHQTPRAQGSPVHSRTRIASLSHERHPGLIEPRARSGVGERSAEGPSRHSRSAALARRPISCKEFANLILEKNDLCQIGKACVNWANLGASDMATADFPFPRFSESASKKNLTVTSDRTGSPDPRHWAYWNLTMDEKGLFTLQHARGSSLQPMTFSQRKLTYQFASRLENEEPGCLLTNIRVDYFGAAGNRTEDFGLGKCAKRAVSVHDGSEWMDPQLEETCRQALPYFVDPRAVGIPVTVGAAPPPSMAEPVAVKAASELPSPPPPPPPKAPPAAAAGVITGDEELPPPPPDN